MSESKILPLVRYWVENFTKHKNLKKSCTQEIIGFREKCPRKISFLGNFFPQKRQGWHFRTFVKSMILKKKFLERKQYLEPFFWEDSDFESLCLQRVRFWNEIGSRRTVLMKTLLLKNHFYGFFTPCKGCFLRCFVFGMRTNLRKIGKKVF